MKQINHIPTNHISFRSVSELKEICHHLFGATRVNHFYFCSFFDSNKMALLTLTPECAKSVIEQNLAPARSELDEGIHYLPASQVSFTRLELLRSFHIHHNLEFVEYTKNSIDLFGFSSEQQHLEITNEYFNKLDNFKSFITEFKERARKLIDQALQEPILLGTSTPAHSYQHKSFKRKNNIVHLSKRELDVLNCVYQGLSAKETAILLNLSPRTVESYLEHIKNKLGVSKKTELLKFVMDNIPCNRTRILGA